MQGFTAFLIYISIFVKQKGIAMKTTAEIIEITKPVPPKNTESKHWAFSVAWLVVNRMRRVTSMFLLS